MLYAIVADDLTGAADAGVEFAQAGWRTRTLGQGWQPADLQQARADGIQVIVIDTQSRGCAPVAAAARVQAAAAQLADAGAAIIFKKIDSTLRGPLGAELDALLDALDAGPAAGSVLAVVCPAFPAAGRTLRDGVLYAHDVPVAQSAAGRDPVTPVTESHLPTLLRGGARRPVLACPPPPRAGAAGDLAADWRARLPQGGCVVVDAQDEEDLARIAGAALADPAGLLLVGSAGLAQPLAAALARTPSRKGPGEAWLGESTLAPSWKETPRGPVLVVCGSLHPAARAQLRALPAQLAPAAFTLLATPDQPLPNTAPPKAASQQAAQALAQTARAWLQTHAAAGLVVTGGDTLASLLAALNARGIDLERALAPGVPVGRLAGGPWAGLPVVSKAGGFGAADTLVQAVRHLAGTL
jgi:uncharacterized protein YgbK (DUF1537 family)